ncbi:LolA family protein [Aquimarina agarilytica]|uniref:LolA family protein n=1 Tax=Aquimarina agarilytica TaxID=1087449 RepID=UPI00028937CB|nr:outer membrane lipoprotein carrier protein LolA [Aquimarina agarilytica]
MKKFLLLSTLLFSSIVLQAQSAKALLDEVSEKVKSYKNIVIDFKYTISNNSANLEQETRGDVTLEGEKYVLNLMGTTQIYDGKKLHIIVPEDEEISISTPTADEGLTPSKMLTFYKKGYVASMDIVQNVNGRKIQYVKLVPEQKSGEITSILLGIDSETKHIYKQVLKQSNGTEIYVTVNQFKTNQPLSNTLFIFDEAKYSDYYINRLD